MAESTQQSSWVFTDYLLPQSSLLVRAISFISVCRPWSSRGMADTGAAPLGHHLPSAAPLPCRLRFLAVDMETLPEPLFPPRCRWHYGEPRRARARGWHECL